MTAIEQQGRGYCRIQAAAAYLGVSPRLVTRLVQERRIPHSRVGRLIVFSYDALDEWVQSNTREAVS